MHLPPPPSLHHNPTNNHPCQCPVPPPSPSMAQNQDRKVTEYYDVKFPENDRAPVPLDVAPGLRPESARATVAGDDAQGSDRTAGSKEGTLGKLRRKLTLKER